MNIGAEEYYRTEILNGLNKLEEKHRIFFKRMYSHGDLEKPIDKVVESMPSEKLDHALDQVNRSVAKIETQEEK